MECDPIEAWGLQHLLPSNRCRLLEWEPARLLDVLNVFKGFNNASHGTRPKQFTELGML
ncbi:hypothetical protein ACLOJK_007123, partial [Asimina triloba]